MSIAGMLSTYLFKRGVFEYMEMTFDNYIVNPMGIKNSVFSQREMYRELYRQKLDKILVREGGKVNYKLYKDKDNYYAWFKIPSEVISNFYYDVVIKFIPKSNAVKLTKSLKEYNVKFYSNDPAFVFTFAYAMEKNKLFIDELAPVMSQEALKERAKERNPKSEVGYVKSLFFAYLLMRQYNLFDKLLYEENGISFNIKELLSKITPADKKIRDRQEAQIELNKKNRIAKAKEANKERDKEMKTTNNTTTSKMTKNFNISKKSKTVGRIKRTKKF